MNVSPDLATLRDFGIALLIGALVGIEREKRKEGHRSSGTPGIRTFALLSLIGAIAGWLSQSFQSPWILVAALSGVSAAIVASYILETRLDPEALGLTTEMAGVAVCLLGALSVLGEAALAVSLAIVISALLAWKQPLHGLVKKIGTEDIYAGLKLLIATFIVLPVLPNHAVDPWDAINPYRLWWLVVLISGLSLVGYVATRWLGSERGLTLTGLTGGLVSSTAVTLSFARKSRETTGGTEPAPALAAGILLSWTVMCARIVVIAVAINPSLLRPILLPVGALGLATLTLAGWHYRGSHLQGRGTATVSAEVPVRNPFSLRSATQFAMLFAAVLLVVKLMQTYLPEAGLYPVAIVAGLTDVDAITLSMAEAARHPAQVTSAVRAIVVAALSNTIVKAALVVGAGSPGLRKRILLAAVWLLAVGMLALLAA